MQAPRPQGLYEPAHEHDACGVGFIAHIRNQPSHAIVAQGLRILKNLEHRGATGYDPQLGDGAGILIQIPDAFLRAEMQSQGITLPEPGRYGVGMLFLPRDPESRRVCEAAMERSIRYEGQNLLGWRDVPVDSRGLAQAARETEPVMRQVFIGAGADLTDADALERKLFVIRKEVEHHVDALDLAEGRMFYVASMSCRTLVYKGMLLADQVGEYFHDLRDARLVSALALVHQRFSTNTFPSWDLAHPFHMIAHNGEINTLRGNINWMHAREHGISSRLFGEDLRKIWPLIHDGQSDSACFDNALELLVMGGYGLAHAMMMLIPEAWTGNALMDADRRAFYEYHMALMEPWDGPAAVAFTDGRQIGATLDRNGLRPARYLLTDDDLIVMASEAGVLPIDDARIVRKWRLQPGRMLLVDLERGCIIGDDEIKHQLATARPYRQWLTQSRHYLEDLPRVACHEHPRLPLSSLQRAFGYSQEDLKFILGPMAQDGEEAVGSMGNDSPLSVLSDRCKPLFNYFRQLFAQVTNPPIDPIREEIVMSLIALVGPNPNLLDLDTVQPAPRLVARQPILAPLDMARLRQIETLSAGRFRARVIDTTCPAAQGPAGLSEALYQVCLRAEHAVGAGYSVVILSDREIDAERAPIPSLLACSAVHQHLVRAGLRTRCSLVVETGDAREVHHCAVLAGYGAEAIHPWLAFASIAALAPELPGSPTLESCQAHYIKALDKGLLKVMSKMGISTYQSYCGAQIFEAMGLASDFIARYFTGTPSRIEGIGLKEVAMEALRVHASAFGQETPDTARLDDGGEYAFRAQGEEHMWTPDAIAKLQHATRSGSFETYAEYAVLINDQSRRHMTLRGLFELRPAGDPVPLDEVEPAREIVKRFATGAMSLGSISTEAHSTLAIAMNRIGGRSNTGEGGEDPRRFRAVEAGETVASLLGAHRIERDTPLRPGDSLRSAIKQVASGRFGVTADYLANAEQIQIKMAQGAKPGEGGQLPGHKVSEYIAELRHSIPGVGLISPPPHHDIYSIEDLAQLIHDLKNANPAASISVKLVSEVGVGTVAAGVAKAKADHLVIAGHDGGTGAAPLSSIKHTGMPWELGLAETQQTLVLNRLRGRVRVQVDGQIKTGRDVILGALLGADEFGFATAPLVVEGCIMMRKCHLNTCPVGVATQDPVLRRRFSGQPEHVVNYFFFVAEEARQLMASLGVRRLDELIGRSDLIDMRKGVAHWKARGLDFSRIFHRPPMAPEVARRHCEQQDHGLDRALDMQLIEAARATIETGSRLVLSSPVRNLNRTVGTLLSHAVVKRHGHAGLADDTLTVRLRGTAGQSLGAFLAHGITLELTGEANDYVGKGLSGGRLIIRPPVEFRGHAQDNIILGNTALYGATAGALFCRGVAGERFAVRNSGAAAVVEGTGDHGCEYMTGGSVVVLGQTGRNFAAGMSGGIAYVLDMEGGFAQRCNRASVALEAVLPGEAQDTATFHQGQSDEALLQALIRRHLELTGSEVARNILADWPRYRARFVKVFPNEYRRVLAQRAVQVEQEVA
ncbi:MAG TPA: glutamate synthase-related protein [Thiobacillaceae bacterium]|nr:glutamate synthase-related protein [Thiobacillaceae bacterium]HNU64478.1 glutamate synthase-related protein [Thiobacillaceae bacterium]